MQIIIICLQIYSQIRSKQQSTFIFLCFFVLIISSNKNCVDKMQNLPLRFSCSQFQVDNCNNLLLTILAASVL